MGGKKSHFDVSEGGEPIFTKETVGKMFDLRKYGGKWDCDKWVFRPFFLPFFSGFPPIVFNNVPPQPSTTHIPCAMPGISPAPPPPPSPIHFPPFSSICPIFPDSKILVWWVGEFGGGERGGLSLRPCASQCTPVLHKCGD